MATKNATSENDKKKVDIFNNRLNLLSINFQEYKKWYEFNKSR